MDQFSRLRLLIGDEAIEKLKTKRIAIFGLGGVGGNVADALVRSGIEHFVLVDNDQVNITNINRQLIADISNIGRDKVDVMEEHLKKINPNVEVIKKKIFYLPSTSQEFNFREFDYVIDAIDTVSAKIDIITKCFILKIPVISALGCGNKLNPTMLEVTDISKTSYDPLARVMRRELRNRKINHLKVVYSKEPPMELIEEEKLPEEKDLPGSSAFVPPVAGIIIASEVVKDLLK